MPARVLVLVPLLLACQSAQANNPTATTSSPQSSHSLSTESEEATPREVRQEVLQGEQAAIARAFEAQSFDEGWRRGVEERLRSALAESSAGGDNSIESVECRQTLCKIVLLTSGGRNRGLRGAIATALDEDDGFLTEHSYVQYGSADRSRSTVYVSRSHYRLPDQNGRVEEIPKKRAGQ
jgi:hypothetical protein